MRKDASRAKGKVDGIKEVQAAWPGPGQGEVFPRGSELEGLVGAISTVSTGLTARAGAGAAEQRQPAKDRQPVESGDG